MDQREFEAVVDELGADVRDLAALVEQARYAQSTALAISRLLDAREDLIDLDAKVPVLRATAAPQAGSFALADLRTRIAQARTAFEHDSDPKAILQLVSLLGERFASLIAPLQAAGRWPKSRSR